MADANEMGHVYAEVTFLGPSRTETRRLMVDTGALYTWIPASLAESMGIGREELRRFRLATGEIVHRWVGYVTLEVLGKRAPTIIVFADEGTAGLLGMHALEGLLLEVDPARNALKESDAANAYQCSEPPGLEA